MKLESSQIPTSTSQQLIDGNPAVVNKSLYPAISYWLAITMPNGVPANPITVHRKLLEHGVSVKVNKVIFIYVKIFSSLWRKCKFILIIFDQPSYILPLSSNDKEWKMKNRARMLMECQINKSYNFDFKAMKNRAMCPKMMILFAWPAWNCDVAMAS